MNRKLSFRRAVGVLSICALAACQTTSASKMAKQKDLIEPKFTPKGGRTVVYMKENFDAQTYATDIDKCRKTAINRAKNYTPPSSNNNSGGYYAGGGGLLGVLITAVAVGVTAGIVRAAQRQDYEDEQFDRCLQKIYQQVYLPKTFERKYASTGSDYAKQGAVLEEVSVSDEFQEFGVWQAVLKKSDTFAFKDHAEQYPDSLFGDLPKRYAKYQEEVGKALASLRTDSYLVNVYFFTYGLDSEGWVDIQDSDTTQITDCSIRRFGMIRARVREGWIQGFLELRDDPKSDPVHAENIRLVGYIEPNGKYQIAANWPEHDPLHLSGKFSGEDYLDGQLSRANAEKQCDFRNVQLKGQTVEEEKKANWLNEPELPTKELAAMAAKSLNFQSIVQVSAE